MPSPVCSSSRTAAAAKAVQPDPPWAGHGLREAEQGGEQRGDEPGLGDAADGRGEAEAGGAEEARTILARDPGQEPTGRRVIRLGGRHGGTL
ncbi:hypothetical protein NF552_18510 [Roseomonas mucosa]|nr:hypothetical protein NF552_18510 [Roseomonas mucosa]